MTETTMPGPPDERVPEAKSAWITEEALRWAILVVALLGVALGVIASWRGAASLAAWILTLATLPALASLALSMARDFLAGRVGVDAVALVSMSAALLLGEPLAGAVVAVMYSGGTMLETMVVDRAQRDLNALIDRAPRLAHRLRGADLADVGVDAVEVGDRLVVRSGEIVPVDGIVADTRATIDESALTGEPIPVARTRGEAVRSGAVNAGATFEMQASATAAHSTYAGIVRMVTAAQTAKAPFIRLADRYAILLLPASLILAGLAWALSGDRTRALAVLVAATPCPLILAAPVAFIAGVARAARRGILVKGGRALEALARTATVLFDKTGTLTVGGARLIAVETAPGTGAEEVLRLAASLEQASPHVVASAIVAAANQRGVALSMPEQVNEAHGAGIEGVVDGRRVRVGTEQYALGDGRSDAWAIRTSRRAAWRSRLAVFVAIDGKAAGALLLADEIRRETPRAIRSLRAAGIGRLVMVTGDRADAAETIANALDLDAVLAERTPADKVDAVATEQRMQPTLMIGDGINDAPALAAATAGIAMGARGATASSEAADVVILVDRLDRVAEAVEIARRAYGIALQSILVGMTLSAIAMAAAAFGWLAPVAAALTQEAIDVAVILNALRALKAPWQRARPHLPDETARDLLSEHQGLLLGLDRLRAIADGLDDETGGDATRLVTEARAIVEGTIAEHEREDERTVYPTLSRYLHDSHGLAAMSRAHREILHLTRLLARITTQLEDGAADRLLVRDAQRVIETIEALVRLHIAQEEVIYEHVAGR